MDVKMLSWKLFEETGAPAAYLLFSALDKDAPKGSYGGRKT